MHTECAPLGRLRSPDSERADLEIDGANGAQADDDSGARDTSATSTVSSQLPSPLVHAYGHDDSDEEIDAVEFAFGFRCACIDIA